MLWSQPARDAALPAVQLCGAETADKRGVAAAACRKLGWDLCVVSAQQSAGRPARAGGADAALGARGHPEPRACCCSIATSSTRPTPCTRQAVARFVEGVGGLVILTGRERRALRQRPLVSLDVARPTAQEQRTLWRQTLGAHGGQPERARGDAGGAVQPERGGHPVGRGRNRRSARWPMEQTRALGEPAVGCVPGAGAAAPGRAGAAHRARGGLGRPGAAASAASDAARDRRAGAPARAGLRAVGLCGQEQARAGHQRALRRRQRHGQDDGGRGAGQRAAARPLPHRPEPGGQQVHRRDREEPAPRVRRRRGRRRHPAVRRGRRAVRQAQRGEGQPRPLRQHRGQLPAAAHGGLSRPGDPDHQHEGRARHGLSAPHPLRRPLPVPGRGPARRDLAADLPGGHADRRGWTWRGWRG